MTLCNEEEMAKILAGTREPSFVGSSDVKKDGAVRRLCPRGVPGQEGDVDVMAEYEGKVTLFDIIHLEDYIEEVLGEKDQYDSAQQRHSRAHET